MFRISEIKRNLITIVGIFLLTFVIIFLLSPIDLADYTVVDTSWHETENRMLLKTAFDYNCREDIERFPMVLGNWQGFNFTYPDHVYEILDIDILMSRAFTSEEGIIFMDIINSRKGGGFHDPIACFSHGWDISNIDIKQLNVARDGNYLIFGNMYVNKLFAHNQVNPDRKQVAMYWYMFRRFGRDEGVTMIRLTAPVRVDTYATLAMMSGFIENELFDAMYGDEILEITIYEQIIYKHGSMGIFIILLLVTIPIIIIFSNKLKKNFKN